MLKKRTIGLAILILISIYAATMIADSITIPSDKNMPNVPKDLQEFVYSTPSIGSKAPDYSGKSPERTTEYIQVPESPIIITKSIIPMSENYHPGDIVAILVEVKNMGIELKNINIKEYVSKGLSIINTSKNAYILKDLDEIVDYKCGSNKCYYFDIENRSQKCDSTDSLDIEMDIGAYLFNQNNSKHNLNELSKFLNNNFDINWTDVTIYKSKDMKILHIRNNQNLSREINVIFDEKKQYAKIEFNNITYKFRTNSKNIYKLANNFDIHIDKIERKDRVAYWYYARLDEIGDFDAVTILRYWVEENSHFLDVDKSLTIKSSKPAVNVDVDINRLNLLKNEDSVNITYKITYMGRPIGNMAKLDFNRKSSYTEIERYGPDIYLYPKDIRVGEPFTKTIKISYPCEGEYFSPEIIINGDVYPFTKEKILVETRFGKYANLVALIMAIVLFFIGDLSVKLNDSYHRHDKSFLESSFGVRHRIIHDLINDLIKLSLPFVFVVPIIYFISTISVLTLLLVSAIIYIILAITRIINAGYIQAWKKHGNR